MVIVDVYSIELAEHGKNLAPYLLFCSEEVALTQHKYPLIDSTGHDESVREKEPAKEIIQRGELLYLWHPGSDDTFSGYGLTLEENRKDRLTGLLMVDRPQPADLAGLKDVQDTYGDCPLVPMTASGQRGLVCQMEIAEESLSNLRQFPFEMIAYLHKWNLPEIVIRKHVCPNNHSTLWIAPPVGDMVKSLFVSE